MPADLTDGTEPALLRNFNLIKLHGSINWRSSGDSSAMVMGRRKTLTIANIPLLAWYHRVFERVLSAGNVRLMVIGYGWADEHINEVIATAVRHSGLQIYSWNPSRPQDMLGKLPQGNDILKGLMGYRTRSIQQVMPATPMNPGGPDYDGIVQAFF